LKILIFSNYLKNLKIKFDLLVMYQTLYLHTEHLKMLKNS